MSITSEEQRKAMTGIRWYLEKEADAPAWEAWRSADEHSTISLYKMHEPTMCGYWEDLKPALRILGLLPQQEGVLVPMDIAAAWHAMRHSPTVPYAKQELWALEDALDRAVTSALSPTPEKEDNHG